MFLIELLETYPHYLGDQEGIGDLPFMFKVLSIDKALSIQVEPLGFISFQLCCLCKGRPFFFRLGCKSARRPPCAADKISCETNPRLGLLFFRTRSLCVVGNFLYPLPIPPPHFVGHASSKSAPHTLKTALLSTERGTCIRPLPPQQQRSFDEG